MIRTDIGLCLLGVDRYMRCVNVAAHIWRICRWMMIQFAGANRRRVRKCESVTKIGWGKRLSSLAIGDAEEEGGVGADGCLSG